MLYTINAFKGVNQALDTTLINSESGNLINSEIRNGTLKQVYKGQSFGAPAITGGNQNTTLMVYHKNGVSHLLIGFDSGIWKLNTTTMSWARIHDSKFGRFSYCNTDRKGEDVLICTNGVDRPLHFNGIGFLELKKLGYSSEYYADPSNRAPLSNYCVMHHERLWLADDRNIYCSSANQYGFDIEDFTVPTAPESEVNQHGAQIFLYDDKNGKIRAFANVFDDLLIFKDTGKVYKIVGTNPSNYQKVELFTGAGAVANRALVVTTRGCLFVNKTGIFMYDGSVITKISEKIEKLWERLDVTKIENAVAVFHDDKYILALTEKGENGNSVIVELDMVTMQFSFIRLGHYCMSFAIFNDELLYIDGGGLIRYYNKGDTPLPMLWESGDFRLPTGVIEVDDVRIHTEGTGKIEVNVITEKKTKTKIIDVTKNETVRVKAIMAMGRKIKFRLRVLEGNITIKNFSSFYEIDEY